MVNVTETRGKQQLMQQVNTLREAKSKNQCDKMSGCGLVGGYAPVFVWLAEFCMFLQFVITVHNDTRSVLDPAPTVQ